ncbi:hypothetical protein [Virgibacillus salexigens]|nr:hypothetical protein [Virgibacillus salexigens]
MVVIYFILYGLLFVFIDPGDNTNYGETVNYLMRIILILIPISVAVFTFAYKETKETAYISLKTSNIQFPFILFNTSAVNTLISCLVILTLDGDNKSFNYLIILLCHSVVSISLFIWYFVNLIYSMDIIKSLKSSLKAASNTLFIMERVIYSKKKNLADKKLKFIFNNLSKYNEANFHLFNKLLLRNHFNKNSKMKSEIYDLNIRFTKTFINTPDKEVLFQFYSSHNFMIEKVTNLYNNILLNYRVIIRSSTKNKLTTLQNELIENMFQMSPLTIIDVHQQTDNKQAKLLGEKVIDSYFSTLFELITELCDEDTVEFSYLLDQIIKNDEPLAALKTQMNIEDDNLINHYFHKLLNLFEALVIWSMESKNLYHLTESVNIVLTIKRYFDHSKIESSSNKTNRSDKLTFKIDNAEGIPTSKVFADLSDMLKEVVETVKVKHEPNSNIKKKDYTKFKIYIEEKILYIIFNAILKSVEIGHYQCTGYMIKVLVNTFDTKSLQDYTSKFYLNTCKTSNITINFGYFHYSINEYSKVYCLNKMFLIMTTQILYRKDDYLLLSFIAKKIEKNDFKYLCNKLINAAPNYGLLSINEEILNRTSQYYNNELLKLNEEK